MYKSPGNSEIKLLKKLLVLEFNKFSKMILKKYSNLIIVLII